MYKIIVYYVWIVVWWKQRQKHHCLPNIKPANQSALCQDTSGGLVRSHIDENGTLRLFRYFFKKTASGLFIFFKVTHLNKTFDKAEHTWRQKARPAVSLILNYFESSSGASLFPEEVRRCPSGLSQSPPLLISSSGSSSLLPQKTKKSPARASRSGKFFSSTWG